MLTLVIADRHICSIFEDDYNITFGTIKKVYDIGKKYGWRVQAEILNTECLNFGLPEQFRGRFVIAIGKCVCADEDAETFFIDTEKDAQNIMLEVQELFGASGVTYVETKYNG